MEVSQPNTPTKVKQYYDRLEREMPDVWRELYPRTYPYPPNCGDYCSAKDPAHRFLNDVYGEGLKAAEEAQRTGISNKVDRVKIEIELSSSFYRMATILMEYGMPQIWISKPLTQALQQTTPPKDINWTTMKLPFPAMILMVPGGTLVHGTEGDVLFLIYSRDFSRSEDGQDGTFSMAFCTRRTTIIEQFLSTTPMIPLGNLARFQQEFAAAAVEEQTSDESSGLTSENLEVGKEALYLLFGALLAMETRPDLIRESQLVNHLQKNGENLKNFGPVGFLAIILKFGVSIVTVVAATTAARATIG